MGNDEFKKIQYRNKQKQLDPSESTDSEALITANNHSKEIQIFKDQIQQLEDQLATYETESQEKEKKLKEELSETLTLLNEKTEAFNAINTELRDKTQSVTTLMNEFEAKNEELNNLEEKLKQMKLESQKQLNEKSEQIVAMELEIKELKDDLTTERKKIQDYETAIHKSQATNEALQGEKEAYLTQIAKMQDVIQQTEEEIKEIEASHLEVQDQLKLEIKRMEDRTGQMREDLARESTGKLARDRHIRVVLQQSELGIILLYLVDYFENVKKKSLALDTLSTEVGIPPIICRTHLRHLHELAVCKFNEVSREIRLIKRAK